MPLMVVVRVELQWAQHSPIPIWIRKPSDRCSEWRRGMTIQRGPKLGGEEVPLATVVHISSAGCRGNAEVATRAHKNVFFIR